MLANEWFQDRHDLFLLARRQLRRLIEKLTHAACRRKNPLRFIFTQKLFDRDAKRGSHRNEQIRARQIAGAFPIADVGVVLVDLPGELPD